VRFISRLAWKLVGAAELPVSPTSHEWIKGAPIPDEDVPPHFWMASMSCHWCGKTLEVYHHVTTSEVAYHYRADHCPRHKAKS
jgi:hypothetical protein